MWGDTIHNVGEGNYFTTRGGEVLAIHTFHAVVLPG